MFTLTQLIIAAVLVAAVLFLVARDFNPRTRHKTIRLANIAEGQWINGRISKLTDGAITARYLLAKAGSDSDHVVVATATDEPYGVMTDEADAAEGPVNVQSLRSASGTLKGVTDGSGVLAFGDYLVPAAAGKVKKLAAGAGNYFIVGMVTSATVAATDALVVQFDPIGSWKTQ